MILQNPSLRKLEFMQSKHPEPGSYKIQFSGSWISLDPDSPRLGFHGVQASGRHGCHEIEAPKVWISWNPRLRRSGFHEIQASGGMDSMKSNPPEAGFFLFQAFQGWVFTVLHDLIYVCALSEYLFFIVFPGLSSRCQAEHPRWKLRFHIRHLSVEQTKWITQSWNGFL